MEMFDYEDIYDEQISPLVKQIIEVCKHHKIPMVASFTYCNEEGLGAGRCSTYLAFDGRKDTANERAYDVLRKGGHQTLTMRVESAS